MEDKDLMRQAAAIMGSKGGNKTAKRGKEYYRTIGKQGAKKRWGK
jgi:hypothetical protein